MAREGKGNNGTTSRLAGLYLRSWMHNKNNNNNNKGIGLNRRQAGVNPKQLQVTMELSSRETYIEPYCMVPQ